MSPIRASTLSALILFCAPLFAVAEQPSCTGRNERSCIDQRGCILDCVLDRPGAKSKHCDEYHCRPAIGACETMYSYAELRKENCEAIAGCEYSPAFCFCPGPMECFCGGGPPASCREKK